MPDEFYPRIDDGDAAHGYQTDKACPTGQKTINIALQGGGSHGAFTWGVLDRLLEDGRLDIEAVSGTSAGAMNAAVMADGFVRGGAQGARDQLRAFWTAVAKEAQYSPVQRAPFDMLMGTWSLDASPGYAFFDMVSKMASPYQLNPFNFNPLKDLLDTVVDFERVRACTHPLIFISCTNVQTGRATVFKRDRISPEVVMASACLPHVFQAVEIDGVPYWDGGYMGNPVLFPFHDSTRTCDYVIVQINPVFRAETPRTSREIMNRINEISFNSALLLELRGIDFVRRLIDEGKLSANEYKRINIHTIAAHEDMAPLGASSKMNGEWEFLQHLFEIGRRAADKFLTESFDKLGVMPTADVRDMYQGDGPDPHPRYTGGLR
ncbi:MAG: patatin-like phospholipase family protein [Hyphomicrobiales bacterium]|nr:patatin-like phospholipase family protein [Hyphomicrobiales bacterium]